MHGCRLFPFQSISYFLYSYLYVWLDAQIQHKAIKQLNGFFYPKSLHDFCQQGCLSSHCWHRAVKSCLHGKLRSRKTDKPVSKKTTEVLNKEPFVRRLRFLQERRHLFKFGLHMSHRPVEKWFISFTFSRLYVRFSVKRVLLSSYLDIRHPPSMCFG